MRIKTYPGWAIDASESQDKHSSMGLLYEANWTNAGERINQTPLNYSKSSVNVSSLGKYQDQLEKIKALEANRKVEATRSFRDFHGYKPSTLKIKRNNKHYNEWDNDPTPQDVVHNPLYNHSQNNWHSPDYLTNMNAKRTDPKLRRSQTVIVKQPTSFASDRFQHSADVQGDIDLRDFYRRRNQIRQLEDHQQSKHPNVNHDQGVANRIVGNGIQKNCDSVSDNNDSLYREFSTNLSALSRNGNDTVNDSASNRMNCYKTFNFYTQNHVNGGKPEKEANGTASRVLLNPLARNKSIKINHFDMIASARDPQALKPEEIDGKLCDTNGKTGKKVSKKNSFTRMFATISAGSKFPRVFLGRSKSRAKLNLGELSENAESQQSNSSLSTLSTSPVYPSSPANSINRIVETNRKHRSASSSDSDSFVIPRPRLIVPVHTYARKRRTGNLTDQSSNKTSCDRNKGKYLLREQLSSPSLQTSLE